MCTFLGAFAPWWNFVTCKIHFASKSCILVYWQRYCTALQQRASAKLCGVVQGMELPNFRREHHLYSDGQLWRWPSAHVLVFIFFAGYMAVHLCNVPRSDWGRLLQMTFVIANGTVLWDRADLLVEWRTDGGRGIFFPYIPIAGYPRDDHMTLARITWPYSAVR